MWFRVLGFGVLKVVAATLALLNIGLVGGSLSRMSKPNQAYETLLV